MSALAYLPSPAQHVRRWLKSSWLDRWIEEPVFDFYARQLSPVFSMSRILAQITDIQREARGVKSFKLSVNGNWPGMLPGQHVNLTVEIEGVRHTRSYSPTLSNFEQITITIKRQAGGKVSNWMHDAVQVGDIVEISPPFGEFVLSNPVPQKILLIGGGSGMTPLIAMIRQMAAEDTLGDVVLLQYAPTYLDLLFVDELTELAQRHPGFKMHFGLTRTPAFEEDLSGHVCREHLQAVADDAAIRETWVCGPSRLTQAVDELWKQLDSPVPLHAESFSPLTVTVGEGVAVKINAMKSQVQFDALSSLTLLMQTERAGLNPESGCRQGICFSCTCRKTRGVVENLLTGEIHSDAEEDIRLCISRPLTDITLEL